MNELTDNRYLQEFIEFKLQQQHTTCTKHKAALTLFCNEEGCQECICVGCTVIQHKGHDIVELEDKAQSARKLVRDGIARAQKCTDGWDRLVEDIEKGKASVNREMDAALKKVENARTEFNKKMVKLAELLEDSTNKQIDEIKATNGTSVRGLTAYRRKINQKKCAIDKQIEKMEKQLRINHDSEVIKLSQETMIELERILRDAACINETSVSTRIPAFRQPQFEHQLKLEDFGATSEEMLNIGRPLQKWIPRKWPSLGLQFWENSTIAVNEDGLVVIYGKRQDEIIALKCFNKEGEEIWNEDLSQAGRITDITFLGRNYIMTTVTTDNQLTLRKASDGTVIRHTNVSFRPRTFILSSAGQGYLQNTASKTIHKVQLEGEVVNIEDEMGIPYTLQNVYGFLLTKSIVNRMMFVLSSWHNNTIQAIDSETGKVIWEVIGEYEGKKIEPHGMCSDQSGHIYVADGSNNRVLQLSCTGQIERCLFSTPGIAYDVQWLEGNSKLLVFHDDGDQFVIATYEK